MTSAKKGIRIAQKLSAIILACALLFTLTALSCFAATAEAAFINSTKKLQSLSGMEWAAAMDNATAKWEAYESAGGVPDANESVEAAYEIYASEKALYDACITFLNNSYEIVSPSFEYMTYEDQAFILDESQNIFMTYKDVNKFASFEGIATAATEFNATYRIFEEQRGYCETYVTNAALAAAANTYAAAKMYIDLAQNAKKKINIEGYPGIDEAEENIDDAKSFISSTMNLVIPFIQAVQDIEYAENEFSAIVYALRMYKGVDSTAEGVASSYASLISYIERYNAKIEASNATARNVSSSVVGLIP